jgi:branched-chain amino acid transport system permease protein
MKWDLILSNSFYTAISANAVAYILVASGLNVHFGYTGLLNFGQAGFAAIGAYSLSIPISRYDWPWPLAVLMVVVSSVILALLLGIPTLRLRADYLAIVTIAVAEIIRLFMNSVRFTWLTGGNDGLQGFTRFMENINPFPDDGITLWAQKIDGYRLWLLVTGWILVALVSTGIWALMRSPWGRVLKSIREDEDAARSLGKNIFAYKMQSLIIGGFVGALGGMWLVLDKQSSQPQDFSTTFTFFAYTIIILGGIARAKGPVIGTMIFLFVIQFVDITLQQATRTTPTDPTPLLPEWIVDENNFSQVRFIVAGLALAILVIVRPQGIFGDKREQAFDVR